MHPLGITLLLVLLWVVLFASRRHALLAMVAGVLYLTQGQGFEVFGVYFYAVRILGMALFIRVLIRGEVSFANLNGIDRALLMLNVFAIVVYLVRRSPDEDLATAARCLDACFCYFGFSGLIKEEDDLRRFLRTLVFLLMPYLALVGIERATGNNPFMFMGGLSGSWVRDGAVRCMGSFRYAVSLGVFAASFLALYVGLWLSKADRRHAYFGIVMCALMVWMSNSGGSVSAAGVVLVGWLFWNLRRKMRMIRWTIIGMLVVLFFVMKAPVWYIIDRVSFGGDGWHRAYLIDVAFRHISQWWLVGMAPTDTWEWFPYTVNGAADITNQYLAYGITAGIGAIALFVLLISRAFGRIGMAMAKLDFGAAGARTDAFSVWGLGVMMAVHVVGWFGVSYFDQMYVIWFLQLAAVTSVTRALLDRPVTYAHESSDLPSPPMEYAEAEGVR